MDQFLLAFSGFLAGALITSLWYTFGLTVRVARIETKLEAHLTTPAPICPLHTGVDAELAVLRDRSKRDDK